MVQSHNLLSNPSSVLINTVALSLLAVIVDSKYEQKLCTPESHIIATATNTRSYHAKLSRGFNPMILRLFNFK